MSNAKNWIAGWGNGLTGPTAPTSAGPCCAGLEWDYVPISVGKETIAIVVQQDNLNGKSEMQRNARLIAAAPELLEALQWLHLGIGKPVDIAAIIAKATGETK